MCQGPESSIHFSRLVIRGAHEDFATLCTSNQVFDIKSAETSNTLLLASPLPASFANKENGCVSLTVMAFLDLLLLDDTGTLCSYSSDQVNSILHSKLELTQCMSKVKRIRQLLERHVYRGQFDEADDDDSGGNLRLKVLLPLLISEIDEPMRRRSRSNI